MHLTRCDLALALAPFRRRPGTALVIIVLLALACALTSTNLSVFSFLYAQPLPYPNYHRVAWIGQASPVQRHPAGDQQTLDNFLFLQASLQSVERIGAFNRWRNETLRYGEITETVSGAWVTPGFLDILGVPPARGATFSRPESIGQSPRPLVLSHRLWERRFQGNPSVLRETVWLNDRPHIIVGVMPADFVAPGYERDEQPEYWAPLDPADIPPAEWKSRWYPTLALLRPGTTLAQLQAELDLATPKLRELYPTVMTQRSLVTHDLKFWLLGAHFRYFNLLLATAALLSVLIALNLVNLLLGKLADQSAYFEITRALGAGTRETVRPLVLEHLLLCTLGLVLSAPLALAYRFLLVSSLGRTGLVLPAFDGALFAGVALGTLALVLATLFIGVRTLHRNRVENPTAGGTSRIASARSRGWLDGAAIFAQVALAIILLVACSMLTLSLRRQASANAHLPLNDLHRAFLIIRPEKYPSLDASRQRLLQIKAALQAHPEVIQAALAEPGVPGVQSPVYGMIDDLDTVPITESPKRVIRAAACPDYFATVGLRVVAGRSFTEQDLHSSRRLLVVSQHVASRYWPGRDAIGRRVLVNHRTDDWAEVIGVVQDLESSTTNTPLPMVWRSFDRHAFNIVSLLFQTRTGRPLPFDQFQRILQQVDPDVMIGEYIGVPELLQRQRWLTEATARITFLLAIVASAVCAFGIFSILNRRVAAAMREIAVRKALGASPWRIVSSIGLRDLGWIGAGLLAGAVLSLVGMRQLFDLTNLRMVDVVLAPMAGTAGVIGGALLGALIPILRALAANTAALLRGEV